MFTLLTNLDDALACMRSSSTCDDARLEDVIRDPEFPGHLHIHDLESLKVTEIIINMYRAVMRRGYNEANTSRSAGVSTQYQRFPFSEVVYLYYCQKPLWRFLDLTAPRALSPYTEAPPNNKKTQFFLATIVPPKSKLAYYIGPPLTRHFQLLLHPNSPLWTVGDIEGITSAYWHVGEARSGTSFECEHAHL